MSFSCGRNGQLVFVMESGEQRFLVFLDRLKAEYKEMQRNA